MSRVGQFRFTNRSLTKDRNRSATATDVAANQSGSTCGASLLLRSYGAREFDLEAVLPVVTRGCCSTRERP